jgi:hypothetical protein
MNKNETVRNLSKAIPESQETPGASDKAAAEIRSGSVPLEGRIEKRTPVALPVYLLPAEQLFLAEKAVTVNVSSRGARVITKRRWQAEDQPWLASLFNEFRLQSRVVYCQPLPDGRFCVGLSFQSGFINLESW